MRPRDRPTVEVTAHANPGGSVDVRIADDGPGIPDDEIALLTDEHDTGPLYHGSGIGLWLVRWVAESSSGDIEFATTDAGETVVTLTLPLADGGR